MQASLYIIGRNGIFMNFSIHGSNRWWSHAPMVCVTALDIQVSLRNPMAFVLQHGCSIMTMNFLIEYHEVLDVSLLICGASSRKPYNVWEKIFFFLADLNSPDSKL